MMTNIGIVNNIGGQTHPLHLLNDKMQINTGNINESDINQEKYTQNDHRRYNERLITPHQNLKAVNMCNTTETQEKMITTHSSRINIKLDYLTM